MLLSGFVLVACDRPTTTPDPGESAETLPAILVGSWVSRPNEFSAAHLVLRPSGEGSTISFREEPVEDSATGEWAYAWVPDDTLRFTWWTGGEYLYTEVWTPSANPPNSRDIIGTQVAKWGFQGDSLMVTRLWGTPIAVRLGRAP